MTVFELNHEQLSELKSAYFWGEETAHLPKYNSLGLPALFPDDLPDGVILWHYAGIEFVEDDFS